MSSFSGYAPLWGGKFDRRMFWHRPGSENIFNGKNGDRENLNDAKDIARVGLIGGNGFQPHGDNIHGDQQHQRQIGGPLKFGFVASGLKCC